MNKETTSTREFPVRGLKKVAVTPHVEPPHGVKFFRTASATQQNVQVVNITNAYKDPTQMPTPRQGLRCVRRSASCASEMRDIMEYKATPQQLRGETLQVPVGIPLKEVERHAPIDYSNLEKFSQAVRDHCQQRARGVTQFYVSLCRDMVGGSTPSTPRGVTPRPWSLEQEPETHSLTLRRCRDQLVALTCIPVTLREIGSLMWDLSAIKLPEGQPPLSDEDLADVKVTYTDFSTAFAGHPDSSRLARMKIA